MRVECRSEGVKEGRKEEVLECKVFQLFEKNI